MIPPSVEWRGPFSQMESHTMKRLLLALLVAAVASGASADDPKTEPNKETSFRALSFDKAVEAAKKEDKVVFIDFYATWCGPCKKLDAETFSDGKVKKFFKDKMVPIKIDVDKDKAMAAKFNIRAMPTMVMVGADGKEIGRLVGFRPAERFLADI